MKARSTYTIADRDKEFEGYLSVTDEDPAGVTIEILNKESFRLPRIEMIEALEYIIKKLKTTIE